MKKIVVKVGTSTLTRGTTKLANEFMLELARQLALLQRQGHKVILVSSGAIAAGREALRHPPVDRSLPAKQMFAAVGQVQLMQRWSALFGLFELEVAQLLLTRDDLAQRKRYLNARDTMACLLQHKIIPIINENDSVATKEIRVGDNDNLAALVANLVAADLLILLTDQQGLYDADPRHHPEARLIPLVEKIDDAIFALATGSSSGLGTGGMYTKIEAAQRASQCGTATVIASAAHPNVLLEVAGGAAIGTHFKAEMTYQESRKRWLLSERRHGAIVIDEGAVARLIHHGASLLPSGIVRAASSFERGGVVEILSLAGLPVAVGMTNYGSAEIAKIAGAHSNDIEKLLGYSYGAEVVHRSNLTRIQADGRSQ